MNMDNKGEANIPSPYCKNFNSEKCIQKCEKCNYAEPLPHDGLAMEVKSADDNVCFVCDKDIKVGWIKMCDECWKLIEWNNEGKPKKAEPTAKSLENVIWGSDLLKTKGGASYVDVTLLAQAVIEFLRSKAEGLKKTNRGKYEIMAQEWMSQGVDDLINEVSE